MHDDGTVEVERTEEKVRNRFLPGFVDTVAKLFLSPPTPVFLKSKPEQTKKRG